jgi:hypothetical protein
MKTNAESGGKTDMNRLIKLLSMTVSKWTEEGRT